MISADDLHRATELLKELREAERAKREAYQEGARGIVLNFGGYIISLNYAAALPFLQAQIDDLAFKLAALGVKL